MGTGKLPNSTLDFIMAELDPDLRGDFAEIGVYRADLFKRLCKIVSMMRVGTRIHAFDSFEGLAAPNPIDGTKYPKGCLSVGGVEAFRKIMTAEGISQWSYATHAGFIPDCFVGFNRALQFCYIDVDHYEPTKQAIAFAWPLIVPGGILGFDDYFEGREELASPAIDEFLRVHQPPIIHEGNNQIFVRKE